MQIFVDVKKGQIRKKQGYTFVVGAIGARLSVNLAKAILPGVGLYSELV
jgi:hypothetical protein